MRAAVIIIANVEGFKYTSKLELTQKSTMLKLYSPTLSGLVATTAIYLKSSSKDARIFQEHSYCI
jgi:hypothetical protein